MRQAKANITKGILVLLQLGPVSAFAQSPTVSSQASPSQMPVSQAEKDRRHALCSYSARVEALTAEERIPADEQNHVAGSTHRAIIADGFKFGGEAGLVTGPGLIVPWGHGDILAARPAPDGMKLFVQYAAEPFNTANDVGTQGGLFQIQNPDSMADVNCPQQSSAYQHHWIGNPQPGNVYCLRSRDGHHYSVVSVDAVCDNTIVLNYRHNDIADTTMFRGQYGPPAPASRSSNLPHEATSATSTGTTGSTTTGSDATIE